MSDTEQSNPDIDALVARAKTNWCQFTHGHGQDRDARNAIDTLAALARSAPSVSETLERSDTHKLYFELIYAVESKWPTESRHQTALRYIRERERSTATASRALSTEPAK